MSVVRYSEIESSGPFTYTIEKYAYCYYMFNSDNGVSMKLNSVSKVSKCFSRLSIGSIFIDDSVYSKEGLKMPMIDANDEDSAIEELKTIGVDEINVYKVMEKAEHIGTIVLGFSRIPNIGDTLARFEALNKLTEQTLEP